MSKKSTKVEENSDSDEDYRIDIKDIDQSSSDEEETQKDEIKKVTKIKSDKVKQKIDSTFSKSATKPTPKKPIKKKATRIAPSELTIAKRKVTVLERQTAALIKNFGNSIDEITKDKIIAEFNEKKDELLSKFQITENDKPKKVNLSLKPSVESQTNLNLVKKIEKLPEVPKEPPKKVEPEYVSMHMYRR